MYLIDREENQALSVVKKTFFELGFKEREHLQEWICNNPSILGEELLIVQKEFSGFADTSERLDLLALDRNGNLVLIENKLDDSGRDVTWQALKYAAYCSTLTTDEIVGIYQEYLKMLGDDCDAKEKIETFIDFNHFDDAKLNKNNLRIILVAANFRKEVTATVMWLMKYGIDLKCIKVVPYQHNNMVFMSTEQIIPVPDAEEYMIRLNAKEKQESTFEAWTDDRFMHAVRSQLGKEAYDVYLDFYNRMKNVANFIDWGKGIKHGGFIPVHRGKASHWIFEFWTDGKIQILFQYLKPPFDELEMRKELRDRIVAITNEDIPDERLWGRPSISWEHFRSPENRQKLVNVFTWFINTAECLDEPADNIE